MRELRIVFLFCIVILTVAFSSHAQTSDSQHLAAPIAAKDDRYRIGFQDVLSIQVYRHSDLDQKVSVSPAGTIILFRLDKPIVAVCKTQEELADDIAAAYKAKFIRDPRVTVNADQQSQSIMVIGSVERAGNYFIKRRYQLLELLAQAGGPNKEAGNRLTVARTGSNSNCKDNTSSAAADAPIELFSFNVRDVEEGKKTLWLQPGDVVAVWDADAVYVYGNVKKQGTIRIKGPTTLMQIIASAEGLEPAAKKDKVRILRQVAGNADRTELVFDLNLIEKGKIKDPFLEPNDIIAVSVDSTKAILRGITNTIKTTIPSAIYRL